MNKEEALKAIREALELGQEEWAWSADNVFADQGEAAQVEIEAGDKIWIVAFNALKVLENTTLTATHEDGNSVSVRVRQVESGFTLTFEGESQPFLGVGYDEDEPDDTTLYITTYSESVPENVEWEDYE